MISWMRFATVIFALCYQLLLYWMLHTFIPLRKHLAVRVLAFIPFLLFADVIVYRNDLDNILLSFCALILYLFVFHQGGAVEKMTAAFIFYPVVISMNFLLMDLGSQIFFQIAGGTDPGAGWSKEILLAQQAVYMAQNLVRMLFWGAIALFLREPLRQIRLNLTTGMWLIVDSIIMVPGIACFTAICFITGPSAVIYPLCIAAIFSSLGCVCLVAYMSASMQSRYALQKLEMQQKYYQDKQKEEEQVRAVYHDMKNHLLVLEASQGSDDVRQTVRELRSQIADYEDYIRTENGFLDIIIKDKAKKAREKHIEFSAAVDFEGVDFIEPLDISTLFGNGLDNAIEASEKLPREQRVILLKAAKVQGFVSILIENNCPPEHGQERARTSEKDPFWHGFGISNMEKAAEKYGGQLTVKKQNGKFILKILIPAPAL